MKKLFVSAALALAVVTSSFAADVKVDKKIQSAFQKEFASAFNPRWESVGDGLFHVSFTQNAEVMDAYYNENAELISLARYVSKDQLPLLVTKTLNEKFKGSEITQIRELVTENETSYLATLKKNDGVVIARVFTTGGVQIVKRIKNGKE
jgi:hypothetical protein